MGGDEGALAKLGLKVCNIGELYAIMQDAHAEMSPAEQAADAARAERGLDVVVAGQRRN